MSVLPPLILLVSTLVQAPQAVVTGTIRDEDTGAPLAGAEVVLPDLSRVAAAGADGRYGFTDVPPGPQHLTVRYIGYTARVLHALVPREGTLEINVALHASPVHLHTIEVRPPVAVRGLDPGQTALPDRSLSIAAIRNHPLLAEPDAFMALGGGDVGLRPESPSGVNVYGGSADETAYALNGIPVLSPYHASGVFTAWNPDALASVSLAPTGAAGGGPGALSGTIAAATRAPGERVRTQGAVSTVQSRLEVDGPIAGGAGFLVSVRSGRPGGISHEPDASRIGGEIGDALATLETPALGGKLRLLGYDNDNELNAAAVAEGDSAPADLIRRRNRYEWRGTSVGGEWQRTGPAGALRIAAWSATAGANASWLAAAGPVALASSRRDLGVLAAVERRTSVARTELGVRVQRSTTTYEVTADSGAAWALPSRTPIASAFVRQTRPLDRRMELEFGSAVSRAAGATWLDPDARLRWTAAHALHLSASWMRRHQFSQSLRNAESLIGNVFPADLYVGSGEGGVPVARSDLVVVAAELQPSPGLHLGAEVYARWLDGLALVAPRSGDPFATAGFAVGAGTVRGAALDASFGTERYAVVASYGYQRLELRTGLGRYTPEYAPRHLLDAGIIVFPTATSSVRVGLTGAAGRRATSPYDAVEWESCNLRDRGCELGGSPRYDTAALGASRLPPYLRLDVGVRQHFHVQMAGRDAVIALFGTMTNLFGRSNLLAYAADPITRGLSGVEMRPLSPLVIGLDWQY